MSRNWIAVASAEHVHRGRAEGFMQVCHGKAAPLRRIRPGDRVVYYSPTERFGGSDRLRAFTAIGVVRDGEPYQVDMGGGFCPFRRDVRWLVAQEAPITLLLDQLAFSAGKRNWGYPLRFGLFEISKPDLRLIATATGAGLPGVSGEETGAIACPRTGMAVIPNWPGKTKRPLRAVSGLDVGRSLSLPASAPPGCGQTGVPTCAGPCR